MSERLRKEEEKPFELQSLRKRGRRRRKEEMRSEQTMRVAQENAQRRTNDGQKKRECGRRRRQHNLPGSHKGVYAGYKNGYYIHARAFSEPISARTI